MLRNFLKVLKRPSVIAKIRSRQDFPLIKNVAELSTLMNDKPYLHDLEVPVLQKYAAIANQTIVEIGAAFGASSALLLCASKNSVEVHSIDPFIVDSMAAFQATKEKCRTNVVQVLKALKKDNRIRDWHLHEDYSFNVVRNWQKLIDFVFIDGDHNYEAVKKDFTDWFPKVKNGGYIAFHDSRKEDGTNIKTFNRGWAGPTQLVKELYANSKLRVVDEAFSLAIFQKIND